MLEVKIFLKKNLLWLVFIAFAAIGIATRQDSYIFTSESEYGAGKYIVWLVFLLFFSYSFYCSRKENFYKSIHHISQMYWGRQIIIDLYIGIILPLVIIYLHGGVYIFLIWIVPILLNANLFTLLYAALNYDSILIHFNLS